MTKPKVTIGICVRNCSSTIGDTIKSILTQDYPHELMELIIVDGNSKDGTPDLVRKYLENAGVSFRVFFEDKGLGYARQMVVDNARGEYIIWVDGDMIIAENYIKELVNFMDKNPGVGIAKGRHSLSIKSNMLGTLESYSRAASKMVDFNSEKAYSKALGTSGAIYRVKMVKQVGGFDKNIRGYCEDWDIEIKARAMGWLIKTINVFFLDYERYRLKWKDLWIRYWRRGYDTHYFLHKIHNKIKNKKIIAHYRMFPLAAIILGIFHAITLYKLTYKKYVFLLPFQYFFKTTAWYCGFINSHINNYKP